MKEFTYGKRTENEKGNLTPRYNIIESLSLSNESNKIPKNENRINIHKISTRNVDENDIIEVFDDELNQRNSNNSLKYYNGTSLSEFIRYIHFLLRKEKDTIDIKDKLCLRGDVNLKDLFFIFDYNKKNKITKTEFKTVSKKIFGLYPTSDQISLVFKRYDKNKDGNLNLREFLGMIKPLKEEYASFLFNDKKKRKETRGVGYNVLSSKSKKLLVEVVRGVIEDEGNYYKYKDDMINHKSFDLNELWDIILRYSSNSKGLDTFELSKLLLDNGYSLSQYELNIVYNKMDYDDDQIISFEDLTQEFVDYYKI
jgi:Ca2+-binding EF-hand superfamily protein